MIKVEKKLIYIFNYYNSIHQRFLLIEISNQIKSQCRQLKLQICAQYAATHSPNRYENRLSAR